MKVIFKLVTGKLFAQKTGFNPASQSLTENYFKIIVNKTRKPKKFFSFAARNQNLWMETREKILAKASEMFLSVGVKNVTMDSIASELGISKRTIYELFKDKDDLVVQSLREMIIRNNHQMLGIISKTDHVIEAIFLIMKLEAERRNQFTKVFIDDVKKYFPAVNALLFACKENLKEFSASYALFEKGIREHIFRSDLKIELVDNFLHELIGMLHTSDRLRALNPEKQEILNNIFLPYFRGICTRKGTDLMDKYFENLNELL